MDLSTFAVNQDRVDSGAWSPMGAGKIRVARANNKNYLEMLQKEMNKYPDLDTTTDEGAKIQEEVLTKVIGHTILTDWEDIKENNEDITYSPAKAVDMLMKYPDFREFVSGVSLNNDHYRINKIKALEGKSKTP